MDLVETMNIDHIIIIFICLCYTSKQGQILIHSNWTLLHTEISLTHNHTYPENMIDLKRSKLFLKLLGHLAQVGHILIFRLPGPLNLLYQKSS